MGAGVGYSTVQCKLGEEGGREGAGGEAVREGESVDSGAVIGGNGVGRVGGFAGEGEGAVRSRSWGEAAEAEDELAEVAKPGGGWLGGGAMPVWMALRRLG